MLVGTAALVRERLGPLTGGPALGLVGLGLVVLGVGLALPLPIPGSNLVFIIPVLMYAIGLLERDGLMMLVGHVMALAGASISWSDELTYLPPSRIRMMQQCLPAGAPAMRPVDLFERAVPSLWHLKPSRW